MRRRIPQVQHDQLLPDQEGTPLQVDSAAWFNWLADEATVSFSYQTPSGSATVRRERKRNGWYWYAYRNQGGKLRKAYLGKGEELTATRLRERIASLVATDEQHNAVVRLNLFGSPTLFVGSTSITLAAKALALLAYLAIRELPQSREQVIALLWPASTAVAGRKNLRNLLWSVRTAVGSPLLEGNERLALRPDVWVDVRQFEQIFRRLPEFEQQNAPPGSLLQGYTALIELYCGPLLEGVAFDDAPDLELWVGSERERLHDAHLTALHGQVDYYRAAGRWSDMLAVARAAIAQDQLQESMHQALMEAYARLGGRSDALRQYDTLCEILNRELQIAPLPETDRLREAILGGTLQPVAPAPPPRRVAPRTAPPAPYIGRGAELVALDELWAQVQGNTAKVVMLVGEAGIGKSHLWRTWAERLPPNTSVWEARCLETTASMPFAPLVELLRSLLLPDRDDALSPYLAATPTWLADLSRLLPELHDRIPDLPQPLSLPPAEEQRRIFEALVQCLQIVRNQPLVLFVDDLHWADRATLDWLGYLLHRVGSMPLLLAGSYRAEEASATLNQLVSSWTRSGVVRQLALNRLNRAESKALIDALGGDPRRVDLLYDQSAGNPYFLRELLQTPPDQLPTALVDLISARLDRLPEAARQVIQAVGVLQPHSDFAALQRTSGRSESETLDAIELLVQRGLLVEHGTGLTFHHPLIAHVVNGSLSGVRRALLHRRAAEAWLAENRKEELAGRLATHYREAGDTAQAARYAELAGDQALSLGALVEASQFYELALELEPTPARYHGLGLAHYWQGDLGGAQMAFTAAHDGAARERDRRGAGRACLELARTALSGGQAADATRWVTLGRSYLAGEDDPTASAIACYLLGTGMRASGHSLTHAEAHLHEALRFAETARARALLPGILFELGNVQAQGGNLQAAIEYFKATIRAAQQNSDLLHILLGHNNVGYHAILIGDLPAAHQHVEAGLALIEERGMTLSRQWIYSTRGELALAEGAWDEAESWFARGIGEAERYNNHSLLVGYRANRARVAWGRGASAEALTMLETARDEAVVLNDRYLLCQIELWLAEWHFSRNDLAHTTNCLDRAERLLADSQYALLRAQAARLRENIEGQS